MTFELLPERPSVQSPETTRTALQLLAMGALIAASLWILRPFLIAMMWAVTIVVATWPILLSLQQRLRGKRSIAVGIMTAALLFTMLAPLYLAISTVAENINKIADLPSYLASIDLPQLPSWLQRSPFIGVRLSSAWQDLQAARPTEIAARLEPFSKTATLWFLGQIGSLGLLLVQLLLTVLFSGILYSNGETASATAIAFARRLAGKSGERAVQLAAQAIRGVASGVVVTAMAQTALAGAALVIAQVPFAIVLTAFIFILALAQVGPFVVLLGAIVWVYAKNGPVWGTAFLVWSLFCVTFDNFLRPVLIRRGVDLPLLLIFVGVVGGLIAFGAIGLFVGPMVLAVARTLLTEWLSETSTFDDDSRSLRHAVEAKRN